MALLTNITSRSTLPQTVINAALQYTIAHTYKSMEIGKGSPGSGVKINYYWS